MRTMPRSWCASPQVWWESTTPLPALVWANWRLPVQVEVAVVDDFAVEGDDDEFASSDFDDGGDVLMRLVFGDGDSFSEQLDAPVRADEPDDFDTPLGGKSGGCGVTLR